jgi:hypothetical protein
MTCHPDEPQTVFASETYLPATLISVRRCPGRQDYLEMRFDVGGKDWHWCFPGSVGGSRKPSRPLALIMTRAGVQARFFDHGVVGASLRLEVAIGSILAGAPTFLEGSLAAAG